MRRTGVCPWAPRLHSMAEKRTHTRAESGSDPLDHWLESLAGGPMWVDREPASTRLARWLDWTDAIALAAVLDGRGEPVQPERQGPGTPAASGASPAPGASVSPAAVCEMLHSARRQLQSSLERTVAEAVSEWWAAAPASRDTADLRRGVTRAQRQMEDGVARWRSRLRSQLALVGPGLRELAAIDAVLERSLAERQRHLLSGAGPRLARVGENATPAAVQRRLMTGLTAELELRLQPLQGLAQAMQPTESTPS